MKSMSFAILTICLASAASAAEKPDQAFLKKAIQGNFAEIQIGQLAQQKGQNEGVKKFGQMLSDDHAAANQRAIDAAKSMGMTPPDGPNAKQRADHQKDIAEYKKEAKQADAAGEYAKAQLDTLQKHLETAKSLQTSSR